MFWSASCCTLFINKLKYNTVNFSNKLIKCNATKKKGTIILTLLQLISINARIGNLQTLYYEKVNIDKVREEKTTWGATLHVDDWYCIMLKWGDVLVESRAIIVNFNLFNLIYYIIHIINHHSDSKFIFEILIVFYNK